MRETNINKNIPRTEVKVGDKIRISRDVIVKTTRETSIYDHATRSRKPITVVGTATDSVALTNGETVTLLERDKPSEIVIPASATHIFWQDTEDYDYYARRNEVSEEWVTSGGPDDTYTTEALIQEIEDPAGEFDEYQEGTFQVLKHKYSAGGYTGLGVGGSVGGPAITLSSDALRSLRDNILPRNMAVSPRIGGQ